MNNGKQNIAYIDGANLHNGCKDLGFNLDYKKFRVWLTEKFKVSRAYVFIGLVPRYANLYEHLQEAGYTLIFKETIYGSEGKIKGNCDADLVLHAVRDSYEGSLSSAVLVSSDGDYASLVRFLIEKNHVKTIISPSNKCCILLRRINCPIVYLDQVKKMFQ